ncbi:HSP20-like chaperone [Neocallimastix lanati (nom. inval.)]|uniref:HSP20-like chaperone n=1 Tax=Neocallimastix californiae TaxID=1754190 RepID=A0A1Y2BRI7_9FUNG|nr:HSP20-like chaperone [Neocallimastix sp. JGI-2020a]ORY37360.1 HSP20-like chaperone [Neocallimastix californiae]|eukprot:ORY37360.1 HSP20-like chaperone [Neocallimastix californiae]
MSLFICEHPLSTRRNNSLIRGSFFDDIENDLENEFFNHPLITFPSLYPYPYLSYNPVKNLEDQISKTFNSDVFKAVDFSPKINLSEDENNYYIQADLPGINKDQVKMELSDDDRVLTILGERETIIDDSDKNFKKDSNKESNNDSNIDSTKNENATKGANENKETIKEEQKETKNNNKKETNKEENNKKYSRIECCYGKFSRSFSIPENADINNIQAKMENGVLEVTLKKIEPQKNEHKHSIQIQ